MLKFEHCKYEYSERRIRINACILLTTYLFKPVEYFLPPSLNAPIENLIVRTKLVRTCTHTHNINSYTNPNYVIRIMVILVS